MKRLVLSLTLFAGVVNARSLDEGFGDRNGCIMLRDIESGKIIYESKSKLCQERIYACSTFKVPLALMAFDAGILKDESTTFKWDGKPKLVKSWEKDQNPRTWLRDSVVWFSQRITPQLGIKKIESYLKDFNYGNQDFSGGIKKAWLSSTLKISTEEQTDFLIRFKKRDLNLKPDAMEKVASILPVEVSEPDLGISGKTGSGFSWEDPHATEVPPYRVGWYVGYVQKKSKVYAFAVVFKAKSEKGRYVFSGQEAKEIAVKFLRN